MKSCRSLFLLKSCRRWYCLSDLELAAEYWYEFWGIFLTALHKIHKGKYWLVKIQILLWEQKIFLVFLIEKVCQWNRRSSAACSPGFYSLLLELFHFCVKHPSGQNWDWLYVVVLGNCHGLNSCATVPGICQVSALGSVCQSSGGWTEAGWG